MLQLLSGAYLRGAYLCATYLAATYLGATYLGGAYGRRYWLNVNRARRLLLRVDQQAFFPQG